MFARGDVTWVCGPMKTARNFWPAAIFLHFTTAFLLLYRLLLVPHRYVRGITGYSPSVISSLVDVYVLARAVGELRSSDY